MSFVRFHGKFREFVIFPSPSLWNWHTEFIFQSQRKRRIFTVPFIPLKRPSVIVELWKWSKPPWPPWIHLCAVCGFIICLLKKQRLNLQLDQIKDGVYRNISHSFPCCGLPRRGWMQMIVFTYDFEKTQVKWNKVKSRWHAYCTIAAPKAAELFCFLSAWVASRLVFLTELCVHNDGALCCRADETPQRRREQTKLCYTFFFIKSQYPIAFLFLGSAYVELSTRGRGRDTLATPCVGSCAGVSPGCGCGRN